MTNSIQFTFSHPQLSETDKVKVVNFTGDEGISRLYEFAIELISDNADLDSDVILESPASLIIKLGADSRNIQGIVSHFEAVKQINNKTIYKAKLVPRLWELSLYHTNEIYLDQTVPEIIETVLKEAGFTNLDYDISGLQGTYKKWPYKCQYGENHLDFISRLMERDGIYYYFAEGDSGEKLVFCDTLNAQETISIPDILYSPSASLEINSLENNVHSFVSQQKRVPHRVLVKDYNDDKPSVDIKGEAIIDPDANPNSEVYVWGQNIETPDEGKLLADIRAEEILAGKKTYHGESSVIRLLAGYNFKLNQHFRAACNQEYLLLSINHEGSDPSVLDSSDSGSAPATIYNNQFSAISSTTQYRPEQLTAKPEIHGTLNAFIDAEGDGQYAELDEEGRYRVTLPFDRVDRDGGKASHWIRMSQPFSGENQGMSFPLHKGAEVLLTFVGGDPDRPIISGSIPNASQPSVTTSDNQTNSVIRTSSGNKIELEDQEGKNRIKLQTGDDKTYMHLGSPNHPGDGYVLMTKGMERKEVLGGQQLFVAASGASYENANGDDATIPDRSDPETGEIGETTTDVINEQDVFTFWKKESDGQNPSAGKTEFTLEDELEGKYLFERRIGDVYKWTAGNEYIYGADNVYDFGNSWDEFHVNEDGMDRTGDKREYFDIPVFSNARGSTGPTADGYDWGDDTRVIDPGEQMVEQKWGDEYTYHHGRRFDWCSDPADYNFGNGYTENLIKSNTETINASHAHDKASPGGPKYGTINGELVKGLVAGTTSAEKTIGDSYSYTNGKTLEVYVGNQESHTYGDQHEEIHGHSISHVRGSCHSTHHGATNDMFMGASSEFLLGATSSMALAGSSEIQVGAANEMFLGLKSSFCISAGFEGSIGPMTTVFGLDVEAKLTELQTSMATMKTHVNTVTGEVNNIVTGVSKLRAVANNLQTAGVSLTTGGIQMMA
ncbi:type VI secretion system tip protein TssI/VgrG [uncultured Psychrosphaera sp.]|uniref:type VI secretion system Vgr family protein n=1 Tax=uncultured Psychrosphaera sp. TaxID=1403522 RepID=UPI0030FA857D